MAATTSQFSSFSVGNMADNLVMVSHLLFADDTLIFCDADPTQIASLRAILARFEEVSGLRINLGKSKLVPIWDARMRLPGQRTRVRRDRTWRHGRDAANRASLPRRATWQVPNRADAAEISANAAQIGPTRSISAVSACIGRNGRVRPKFKKKKNGANAPFY